MNHILTEIASTYKLKRRGDRWIGQCPKCGGSDRTDKFNIRDDGGFKCYSCDFKGDIITWLRQMENKTCPEAHSEAGIQCRSTTCAVRSTCRLGDGTGTTSTTSRRRLTPVQQQSNSTIPTTTVTSPFISWAKWADALLDKSTEKIKTAPGCIKWLASRGIDAVSICRFRLGWMDHDIRVDRAEIGLPPAPGKKKLWIPGGLVIPTIHQAGGAHRLRIRRTVEAMEKFLPDLKYVWIQGSGTSPMVIRPRGVTRGTVIVEAELDAMAVASAHPDVLVIAIGTVAAGLPDPLRSEVSDTPVVLVALDADQTTVNKPAAGPKAIKAWLSTFRHAKYWPVPDGKDPGEYAQAGGSLRSWIESGLFSPSVSQDQALIPERSSKGERGAEQNTDYQETDGERSKIITLKNGRQFHITGNQGLWHQLTDAGETVFSANELLRLQSACRECTKSEAKLLTERVLDIKEVFNGAYIQRGGGTI